MHVKVNPILLRDAVLKLRHLNKVSSLDIKYMVYCLNAKEDNTLDIIASDLDSVSIKVTIPVNVIKSGCININGNNFQKVINKIQSKNEVKTDIVDLKLKDNNLMFNTKTIYNDVEIDNSRLFTLVEFDFSNEGDSLKGQKLSWMDAVLLKDMLNICASITDNKNVDYIELSGIAFKLSKDGHLVLAGCDGPKLVECSTMLSGEYPEVNAVLPKIIFTILNGSVAPEEQIGFVFSDREARFELHKDKENMHVVITCSLVYGNYPNFNDFFNVDAQSLILNNQLLLDNILNISDILSDDSFKVELKAKGTKLDLKGASSLTKEIRNEGLKLNKAVDNEVSIVINANDIKSILSFIKDRDVELRIGTMEQPITILPITDNPSIALRGLISPIVV